MYFDDCRLGQQYELKPVLITSEDIKSFAEKYDPLPLHTDEGYAEKTRFGGIIAPGVMSFMTVWAELVKLNIWGDEIVAGKSTKITWLAPVYPGDELTATAEITKLEGGKSTGLVEMTVNIYNQDKLWVISNVTETVVKRRA